MQFSGSKIRRPLVAYEYITSDKINYSRTDAPFLFPYKGVNRIPVTFDGYSFYNRYGGNMYVIRTRTF